MTDAGVGLIKTVKFINVQPSLLIAVLVFSIHLFAIGMLLHDNAGTSAHRNDRPLQFRLLPATIHKPGNSANTILAPYLAPRSTAITLPLQPLVIDIDTTSASSANVERSEPSDPGLFDPRLRKKLSDIGSRPAGQPLQELKSVTDSSGKKIVEIQQGKCIRTMPGTTHDRGENWSLRFKCGKNEGERMIDNINADMAERKKKHSQ